MTVKGQDLFSSFYGKTVDRIVDRGDGYGGLDVIFTDGSGLRVEGDGYETSEVTASPLSLEDRRLEAREREGKREKGRVWRLYREARQQEEDRAEAALSAPEFEAWMDEHRPGWRYRAMVTEEIQGAYLDMLRAARRQIFTDSSPIAPLPE